MIINSIKVPVAKGRYSTFKIRNKEDAKIFIDYSLCSGQKYHIQTDYNEMYIIEKKNENEISIFKKIGDLKDIFNPCLEIANTNNKMYDKTVYDIVWKIRKSINEKWFNKEE